MEEQKEKAIILLANAIETMAEQSSTELRGELENTALLGKMSGLLTLHRAEGRPIMGLLDIKWHGYVTIDILALITVLTTELSGLIDSNQNHSAVSVGLSVLTFVVSFLNSIEPAMPVDLEETDARIYCKMLSLQRDRPVNAAITLNELKKELVADIVLSDEDMERSFDSLKKKKLIVRAGDGFLVKKEVKVKQIEK